MRGILKKLVSGVLVGCIAFGTIATASAIQGMVTKELYYGDISVSLDGKKLTLTNEGGGAVEPFAIDGTTYLPIRAISSALGLGVEWNQEGQEVKLTSPEEQSVSSCILVRPHADGAPEATVTVLEKDGDFWKETMSTDEAFVGRNGTTSNKQEGDGCTPRGIYTFGQAFGVAEDPGSARDYLQVGEDDYWVDDSDSVYYNQMVKKSETEGQWDSAEHLVEETVAYEYAIAINYNTSCTPSSGSAIFFHCSTGNGTAGCVSVPREMMVEILQTIQEDTIIVIM